MYIPSALAAFSVSFGRSSSTIFCFGCVADLTSSNVFDTTCFLAVCLTSICVEKLGKKERKICHTRLLFLEEYGTDVLIFVDVTLVVI